MYTICSITIFGYTTLLMPQGEKHMRHVSTDYLETARSVLKSYDIYSLACADVLNDQDTITNIRNTLNGNPLVGQIKYSLITTAFYREVFGNQHVNDLKIFINFMYSDLEASKAFQQWHREFLTQEHIKIQIIESALLLYKDAEQANQEKKILSQISEDMIMRAYANSLQEQYLPYETLRRALHMSIIHTYALWTWSKESVAQ